MNKVTVVPRFATNIFFLIGLTSALCFRLIIVVQHYSPAYVRIIWYLAVIANLVFFFFRYHISRKRKRAVSSHALMQKLVQGENLDEEERSNLIYLLTSIEQSYENLNYMSIFILSALAILIDIVLTLAK